MLSSDAPERARGRCTFRRGSGSEQVVHHVEHEQRAHPVVGEALPHLGEEQDEQALRVPEQDRLGGARSLKGDGPACSAKTAASAILSAGKRSIPNPSNDRLGSAIVDGTAVEACRRQRAQAGRRIPRAPARCSWKGSCSMRAGKPLTGSFQDCAMPRADDFPALVSPPRNESSGGIALPSYKTERSRRSVLLIPPASPKPLQGSPRAELSGPGRSPAHGSTPRRTQPRSRRRPRPSVSPRSRRICHA